MSLVKAVSLMLCKVEHISDLSYVLNQENQETGFPDLKSVSNQETDLTNTLKLSQAGKCVIFTFLCPSTPV